MSVVAAAVVGSAVVGGVVSNNASKRATKSADRANEASLAFEQQKYDDWKDTYGAIEDNLADYYGNLTPEYYEAMGLQTFQQEYETNMTRLNESLAQRGIVDSGISASLQMQSELGAAESRATIRRDSERNVNAEKASFLQIGLGQNPGNSMSNALQNEASSARARANSAETAAGQAVGNAISTIGQQLVDYKRAPSVPTPSTGVAPSNKYVGID